MKQHIMALTPTHIEKHTKTILLVLGLFMIISYFFFDKPTAYFFYNLDLTGLTDRLVRIINNLGLGWIYLIGLPVCAVIAWLLKKTDWLKAFVFLFLCVLVSAIACDVIKITVARARPHELFEYQRYGFYWFKFQPLFWSFPSGHTTVITTVMLGLSYLKPNKTVLFLLIAFVISFMRLVVTGHYISDVLGGYCLALVITQWVHHIYKKKGYKLPNFQEATR